MQGKTVASVVPLFSVYGYGLNIIFSCKYEKGVLFHGTMIPSRVARVIAWSGTYENPNKYLRRLGLNFKPLAYVCVCNICV